MDILIIVAGLAWIIYGLIKDSNTKSVPMGSDIEKAHNDYYSGRYTSQEVHKRLVNGYYVKKDNK